jgi:hypothetical protein
VRSIFTQNSSDEQDDSGIGKDLLEWVETALTDSGKKILNDRLQFVAMMCSCPLRKEFGDFARGFVSSDDRGKLLFYMPHLFLDLVHADYREAFEEAFTAHVEFR